MVDAVEVQDDRILEFELGTGVSGNGLRLIHHIGLFWLRQCRDITEQSLENASWASIVARSSLTKKCLTQ
jgi:hypothetical protein